MASFPTTTLRPVPARVEPPKMIDLREDGYVLWYRYIEYISSKIAENSDEWKYMRDEVKPLGKQACDHWTDIRYNFCGIDECKRQFELFKLQLIRRKKYEAMYDELLAARGDKEPSIEDLRAYTTDQKVSACMTPVSDATNGWASICTCCGTMPLSHYNVNRPLFSGGSGDAYRRCIYFQFAQPGKQQDLKETHPEELVIEDADGLFILNWVDE